MRLLGVGFASVALFTFGDARAAVECGESDGAIAMSRALCAYPNMARFDERGDPKIPASFHCVRARETRFEHPAGKYWH